MARTRYTAGSRDIFTLKGGNAPRQFSGDPKVRLSSPSTLIFTMDGKKGRFVEKNDSLLTHNVLVWEEVK